MINTKDNIFCQGFNVYSDYLRTKNKIYQYNIIYSGKTSDIPEEIAKKCADTYYGGVDYFDYESGSCKSFVHAKDSIQSALIKPDGTIYDYCIIFKK